MKSTPNSSSHFRGFGESKGRGRALSAISGQSREEELLLIGAEFEMPSKIPFMVSGHYRWLPGIVREWMRSAYGLATLLFEKLSSRKNQAFIELLGQVRLQAKRIEVLEQRIKVLESHSAGRNGRRRKGA